MVRFSVTEETGTAAASGDASVSSTYRLELNDVVNVDVVKSRASTAAHVSVVLAAVPPPDASWTSHAGVDCDVGKIRWDDTAIDAESTSLNAALATAVASTP